jgi:hypothetical protein
MTSQPSLSLEPLTELSANGTTGAAALAAPETEETQWKRWCTEAGVPEAYTLPTKAESNKVAKKAKMAKKKRLDAMREAIRRANARAAAVAAAADIATGATAAADAAAKAGAVASVAAQPPDEAADMDMAAAFNADAVAAAAAATASTASPATPMPAAQPTPAVLAPTTAAPTSTRGGSFGLSPRLAALTQPTHLSSDSDSDGDEDHELGLGRFAQPPPDAPFSAAAPVAPVAPAGREEEEEGEEDGALWEDGALSHCGLPAAAPRDAIIWSIAGEAARACTLRRTGAADWIDSSLLAFFATAEEFSTVPDGPFCSPSRVHLQALRALGNFVTFGHPVIPAHTLQVQATHDSTRASPRLDCLHPHAHTDTTQSHTPCPCRCDRRRRKRASHSQPTSPRASG